MAFTGEHRSREVPKLHLSGEQEKERSSFSSFYSIIFVAASSNRGLLEVPFLVFGVGFSLAQPAKNPHQTLIQFLIVNSAIFRGEQAEQA